MKRFVRPALEFLVLLFIFHGTGFLLLQAGVPPEKAAWIKWVITILLVVAYLAYLKLEEGYGGLRLDKLFPSTPLSDDGYIEEKPSKLALRRARKAYQAKKRRMDVAKGKEKGGETRKNTPPVDIELPDAHTSGKSTPTSTKGSDMKKAVMSGLAWLGGFLTKYPLQVMLAFSGVMMLFSLKDGLDQGDWKWFALIIFLTMTVLKWWGPAGKILWRFLGYMWGKTWGKWVYLISSALIATFLWSTFANKGEMPATLLWVAIAVFPFLGTWLFVKSVK